MARLNFGAKKKKNDLLALEWLYVISYALSFRLKGHIIFFPYIGTININYHFESENFSGNSWKISRFSVKIKKI